MSLNPTSVYGASLTIRENETLALLAHGHSTAETAESMGIHIRTVKQYMQSARVKTGCRTSWQLMATYGAAVERQDR